MVYDGDGNRVVKTAGGVTTRYLMDDLTPTGYAQVAEEVVGGAVVRRYTHGTARISQTQLIAGNWVTHYYGYDGGFHVRQLSDAAGVVTDSYSYDAYGNLVAVSGATPNVFLYRGEQYDPSLQMYYLRARWYWPQTGRFVTADTYKGEKEEPPSLHWYLYAHAEPVNGLDPSGQSRLLSGAAIYGAMAATLGPAIQRLGLNARGLASLGEYVYPRAVTLQNILQMYGRTWIQQGTGRIMSMTRAQRQTIGVMQSVDKISGRLSKWSQSAGEGRAILQHCGRSLMRRVR